MKEKWSGDLVGKMFRNDVSRQDLADEMGVTKAYVCMLLNGERTPDDAQKRMEEAYNAVIKRRRDK